MVPFLYTTREHHNVRTPGEYAATHRQYIAKRRRGGARAQVHESLVDVAARIDCNTWLVDCECGAGNAIDPDHVPVVAHCFGCGAIHRRIAMPPIEIRQAIALALLARTKPKFRSWSPGETVADLARENELLSAGAVVFTRGGAMTPMRTISFIGDDPVPQVHLPHGGRR